MSSFGRGSVGTAYVTILADTSRFGEDVRKGIASEQADIEAAGELINDAQTEGFTRQAKKNKGKVADAVLNYADARGALDANADLYGEHFIDKLHESLSLGGHQLGRDVVARIAAGMQAQADRATPEMRAIVDAMNKSAAESARAAAAEQVRIDNELTAAKKANYAELDKLAKQNLAHQAVLRDAEKDLYNAQLGLIKINQMTIDIDEKHTQSMAKQGEAARSLIGDLRRLGRAFAENSKDAKASHSQFVLIAQAIAVLGPALVPLGAAAIAGLGVLANMAAVAGLAFVGFTKNIKDSTDFGKQAQETFKPLTKAFFDLADVAAKAALPGLAAGIGKALPLFSQLTPLVDKLAESMGKTAGNVGAALITMFVRLGPLTERFALWIEQLSVSLLNWSSGDGFQGFLDYVNRTLPSVLGLLSALGHAFTSIVEAAAPLGGPTIAILTGFLEIISALPTPVLTALIALTQLVTIMKYTGIALGGIGKLLDTLAIGFGKSATGSEKFATALKSANLWILAATVAASIFFKVMNNKDDNVFSNTSKETKESLTSLADAFKQSGGIITDEIDKIFASVAQDKSLSKAFTEAGIGVDQFTSALEGSNEEFGKLLIQLADAGQGAVLDDLIRMKVQYDKAKEAAEKLAAAQRKIAESKALNAFAETSQASIDHLSQSLSIGTDEVTKYASMIGISAAEIKKGAVSNLQLAQAVTTVKVAYDNANASQGEYLGALQKFSSGTGTAAERAAFIGATLKAANGDMITFTGSMAAGYEAVRNLAEGFNATTKSAINLNTGTIDYTNKNAPALVAVLDDLQSAAMKAAEAQFLHEKATLGGKVAADNAYETFNKLTRGALVEQAQKLGLTTEQAQKLADTYFAMPKDVKTRLEAIGTDPIIDVLNQIGLQLSYLTKTPWVANASVDTGNSQKTIADMEKELARIDRLTATVDIYAVLHADAVDAKLAAYDARRNMTGGVVSGIPGKMAGGLVGQEQLYRVGEIGMREAIIPLDLPMSRVSPDVREMAQLLRDNGYGKATGNNKNKNMVVNVFPVQADPVAVAESVLNRAVADARF